MVAGIALTLLPGLSTLSVTEALLGVLAGFAILLPGYVLGKTGAGDVKLMAMAGAYLGLSGTVIAALVTFITGGVVALCWVVFQHLLKPTLQSVAAINTNASNPQSTTRSISHHMLLGYIGIRQSAGDLFGSDKKAVWHSRFPYALAIATGCVAAIALDHYGLGDIRHWGRT